jgi:hypothetical protein
MGFLWIPMGVHRWWNTHGFHYNPWVFMGGEILMDSTIIHEFSCGNPYPIMWV